MHPGDAVKEQKARWDRQIKLNALQVPNKIEAMPHHYHCLKLLKEKQAWLQNILTPLHAAQVQAGP